MKRKCTCCGKMILVKDQELTFQDNTCLCISCDEEKDNKSYWLGFILAIVILVVGFILALIGII